MTAMRKGMSKVKWKPLLLAYRNLGHHDVSKLWKNAMAHYIGPEILAIEEYCLGITQWLQENCIDIVIAADWTAIICFCGRSIKFAVYAAKILVAEAEGAAGP
jgi:hypothetical protein